MPVFFKFSVCCSSRLLSCLIPYYLIFSLTSRLYLSLLLPSLSLPPPYLHLPSSFSSFPLRLGTLIGMRFCLSAVLHIRMIRIIMSECRVVAEADDPQAYMLHVAVVSQPVSVFFQKNLKNSLNYGNLYVGNLRFICLFDLDMVLFSRIQKICKKSS